MKLPRCATQGRSGASADRPSVPLRCPSPKPHRLNCNTCTSYTCTCICARPRAAARRDAIAAPPRGPGNFHAAQLKARGRPRVSPGGRQRASPGPRPPAGITRPPTPRGQPARACGPRVRGPAPLRWVRPGPEGCYHGPVAVRVQFILSQGAT